MTRMKDIYLTKKERVGKIVKDGKEPRNWKANAAWTELSVGYMAEVKWELLTEPAVCILL